MHDSDSSQPPVPTWPPTSPPAWTETSGIEPVAGVDFVGSMRPYPDAPVGIGGWLILVVIGLVLEPLRLLAELYLVLQMVIGADWRELTSPVSERYIPGLAPLVAAEAAGMVGLLAFVVVVAAFFVRKSRRTPRLMVAFLVLQILFRFGDAAGTQMVMHSTPDTWGQIAGGSLASVVWITYWWTSKRVANTFVY